jgi:hypothetical protein
MATTLKETEQLCRYIRTNLEDAINVWVYECSSGSNYSDSENLYMLQEKVREEDFELHCGPQASFLQDGRGPSDGNSEYFFYLPLGLEWKPSPLLLRPFIGLLYQPWLIGDDN